MENLESYCCVAEASHALTLPRSLDSIHAITAVYVRIDPSSRDIESGYPSPLDQDFWIYACLILEDPYMYCGNCVNAVERGLSLATEHYDFMLHTPEP